jgi:hypothetical protein
MNKATFCCCVISQSKQESFFPGLNHSNFFLGPNMSDIFSGPIWSTTTKVPGNVVFWWYFGPEMYFTQQNYCVILRKENIFYFELFSGCFKTHSRQTILKHSTIGVPQMTKQK